MIATTATWTVMLHANCGISLKPSSDGLIRNATLVSSVPFSADVSYFEIGLCQFRSVYSF